MDLSHIFNSKKFFSKSFCAVLFSLLSFTAFSQEHTSADTAHAETSVAHAEGEEKEEDISQMILHHIADSHEWHFFGDVSVPLPVILYTENGLVTFLSNKFGHNDHGTEVINADGVNLVNYHGKYYYPSAVKGADGTYITHDSKGDILNTKPLDISITKNVVSLLISVIVLLVVFIGIANAYKKREGKAPKGLQSILEPIILFVRDDIAKPQLGYRYKGFMPYLLTVFFFVWLNNLMGLIPFFPGGANLTGNIAVTMMLALCTFVLTTINGNKNYWGHVFTPHVPWWLYPLMIPVEIIGLFTKPIALMIRLFANITAGHILILSLISLIFIIKSVLVAGVAIPFVLFISVIELVVGFIQAFIFTILSALFIGMAVEEHAEH
ncbi:F0F1 ATP synthase subunit A [Daejeonella lutea]|uniref:ATP synthase subunit a n=1 Tax=Daejeonella lutea TaxID=572036 RepID=A0A1T5CZQ4_9SPHI|nr:F0F1 ATP synthase subunit A [Daejeonella lutea]SKB64700.1 F-type H+-transporting ATPase subunit a [Daejeonella lutea]